MCFVTFNIIRFFVVVIIHYLVVFLMCKQCILCSTCVYVYFCLFGLAAETEKVISSGKLS